MSATFTRKLSDSVWPLTVSDARSVAPPPERMTVFPVASIVATDGLLVVHVTGTAIGTDAPASSNAVNLSWNVSFGVRPVLAGMPEIETRVTEAGWAAGSEDEAHAEALANKQATTAFLICIPVTLLSHPENESQFTHTM